MQTLHSIRKEVVGHPENILRAAVALRRTDRYILFIRYGEVYPLEYSYQGVEYFNMTRDTAEYWWGRYYLTDRNGDIFEENKHLLENMTIIRSET